MAFDVSNDAEHVLVHHNLCHFVYFFGLFIPVSQPLTARPSGEFHCAGCLNLYGIANVFEGLGESINGLTTGILLWVIPAHVWRVQAIDHVTQGLTRCHGCDCGVVN